MSTHTPGDWIVDRSEGKLTITRQESGPPIANIRLIAAAPVMLEALQEASWLLHELGHTTAKTGDPELDRIDAAIKAATGEEE